MLKIIADIPSDGTLEAHARDMERDDGPSLSMWRRDVAVIQHLIDCGEIEGYLEAAGWKFVPCWAKPPYVCPTAQVSPLPSPAQSRDVRDLHPLLREFVAEVRRRWSHAFVVEAGRTLERQQWLFGQGRTMASALVEFPNLEALIRSIPGGCWDPRQRVVTWTLHSRHLFQPDGYSHAVDIGLLNGRKGLEQDSRAYQSFVANARQLLLMLADQHGGISDAKNGGARDLMHWQINVRG